MAPENQVDTGERSTHTVDRYLARTTKGGYGLATLLFVTGIYFDWQAPGTVIIPMLVFTDDPYSNSGLFVLAVLVGFLSYLLDLGLDRYRSGHDETKDETQEWTVDLDSEY